ncbi:unnamed protein product [Caenorhabditis angaria]|uniref:Translation initiation factor eIF2B subunit alpha n=1 Tax=Caenorhabditis angaria TaxID=860376 RepID=A0A9P1IHN0_9PELO|nr:unnamed protein product [Caenorhabditis angaria]
MVSGDSKNVQTFRKSLETDPNKSTGLAAIETLYDVLKNTRASTAGEFQDELGNAVKEMLTTDYSSTSIRSATNLFRKFISLAPVDITEKTDFSEILEFYRKRGVTFIERVSRSRSLISKYAKPFFRNNMNILTHSYSKVVLSALHEAHECGIEFHVWVTESQPDASGKRMHEALKSLGIETTLVLDSCVGYLMERMQMVVVGAEGVMETGGIINKIGTLNVSIIAKTLNVPVFVMAESIKFVDEYPLNQEDIPETFKYRSSVIAKNNLASEHPEVDYTPPQYLNLLITDLGILPPAAVGEELIKLYT